MPRIARGGPLNEGKTLQQPPPPPDFRALHGHSLWVLTDSACRGLRKVPTIPFVDSGNEMIRLDLSRDEAWELLSRCMRSEEPDDDSFRMALEKLARALRSAGDCPAA
jgi:hypothetical protein